MNDINIEGWRIREDHHSAFVREFHCESRDTTTFEYKTQQMYKGKPVDAVYDAKVLYVRVRHQWDEDKKYWWSQATRFSVLLNSKGEPYKTGWQADYRVTENFGPREYSGSPLGFLVDFTHPRTVITVLEGPE